MAEIQHERDIQHEREAREERERAAVGTRPLPEIGTPEIHANAGMVQRLEELLSTPAVASERVSLIAQELAQDIEKNLVVDWDKRDAVQARLRNVIRVVLRKDNYPPALREQIVNNILDIAVSNQADTNGFHLSKVEG